MGARIHLGDRRRMFNVARNVYQLLKFVIPTAVSAYTRCFSPNEHDVLPVECYMNTLTALVDAQ